MINVFQQTLTDVTEPWKYAPPQPNTEVGLEICFGSTFRVRWRELNSL